MAYIMHWFWFLDEHRLLFLYFRKLKIIVYIDVCYFSDALDYFHYHVLSDLFM